ncbi:unnamed protein product [Rotaria sordida]|uniref:Uncharacterized protein n=1 Tax=Rotaria sordida TaxID=392033 RepID=A0A816EFU7_9BILA|nr:unnamed protein product [Rotaria sordida]CAF1649322.1 unnamed protein product [Rotaria sordida]
MLNIKKHLYAENNLTAINLLLIKQTTIEEELLKRQQQVDELCIQVEKLKQLEPEKFEEINTKQNIYQYYYDLSKTEAWLGEQELYMMSEEHSKNELSTQIFIRKRQTMKQTIENYNDILCKLSNKVKNLIIDLEQSNLSCDLINEHHDLINKRQTQLNKLYTNETLKLYRLHREIDDLEQSISDRELIAGSYELGQDFEYISILLDRFPAFAQETEQIGNGCLQHPNEMIHLLIVNRHVDSSHRAELKVTLNESYQDLLEMIETHLQSLKASWELHKFLHDHKEILLIMQERKNSIPDEIGHDQQSVQQLLSQYIQRIQQESKCLNGCYAGEKETEIKQKEMDVLTSWKLLQQFVDQQKHLLNDYEDLHRFFNLTRDLHM